MARERRKWKDHLYPVLSTKPAEVVQEACQVLEKHGCRVEEKLKSELYTARTHAHTKYCRFGGPIEALRTTSSFLHTGHLIIVDYLLVASLTAAMVDASTIIDNEQCRLAGLSIILFAGKLFANCNLPAKCVTLVPQKFPLLGMLPLKC